MEKGVWYDVTKESIELSLMVISVYKYLVDTKKEYIMSKQLLRSGTSIGANIHEAQQWSSKKDFLYKMNISLKEAYESQYWITLLTRSWYLDGYESQQELQEKVIEISKVLSKIVKSTKESLLKK